MKTHEILKDAHYPSMTNYGEIAKDVAGMVKSGKLKTKEDVLTYAESKYGRFTPLTMKLKASPNTVFGDLGTLISWDAYNQLQTALKLPVATRGAIMPDGHYGYALPIGGVVELANSISPQFVGGDIGCMMHMTILDVDVATFERDRVRFANDLVASTCFGNPKFRGDFKSGKHDIMLDSRWNSMSELKSLKSRAEFDLGTSGAGNHFADLMVIKFRRPVEINGHQYRIRDEAVVLLTHSGSRGSGAAIAKKFSKYAKDYTSKIARGIPSSYEWLSLDDELGQKYLTAMQLMGDWALANHEVIHNRFMKLAGLRSRGRVWNRHNFAWVDGEKNVIHRKGATPSDRYELGIIPASSGSDSHLVMGLGNESALNSSSHGAGRFVSRTQAKKDHDAVAHAKHMSDLDILTYGLDKDESSQAYKPIEDVIGAQENVLIQTVATMSPRVVIMGGSLTSDDGD